MAAQFFNPIAQYLNGAGRVIPGAQLEFFANGTTTPQDTFADAALTTPNTNPVVCDADGRIPPIFMPNDDVYTIVFRTSVSDGSVQFAQVDDYVGADGNVSSEDVRNALDSNTDPITVNGPSITFNMPITVVDAANTNGVINLQNTNAAFTGIMDWRQTTRASSTAFDFSRFDANGVTVYRVFGNGDLTIAGNLSKASGSFRIKHPLMPETHELVYSFIESPRAENLYRDMVDLVAGKAQINLDQHFGLTEGTYEALNHTRSWSTTNETGFSSVKSHVSGNILYIECEDLTSTDTVCFEVRGERKDDHMMQASWTDEAGRVITEPEISDKPLQED